MKELRKRFEEILIKWHVPTRQVAINELLQAVEDYIKQTGRRGGLTTKKNHPNHFKEIGRQGGLAKHRKRRDCKIVCVNGQSGQT